MDLGTRNSRLTVFLLLWLGMETAGFFLMSPFPAVRRVLGLTVVLILLTGRFAALTGPTPAQRRTLQVILFGGGVLGCAYFALNCWEAKVQQLATDEAADWIEAHGGGRVWFTDHWSFQYYAEHRGMQPVYVHSPPSAAARLRVGDFLVVPTQPYNQQAVLLDPQKLHEEHVVTEQDWLPLQTLPNFYGGPTALHVSASNDSSIRNPFFELWLKNQQGEGLDEREYTRLRHAYEVHLTQRMKETQFDLGIGGVDAIEKMLRADVEEIASNSQLEKTTNPNAGQSSASNRS